MRVGVLKLTISGKSIPQGHELRLHVGNRLVLRLSPLPQEAVHLINEDDGGLELVGESEHSSHCMGGRGREGVQ